MPNPPSEPLPCPHCGAKPTLWYENPPIPLRQFDYGCACPNCYEPGAIIAWGEPREEAIQNWNDLARAFPEAKP